MTSARGVAVRALPAVILLAVAIGDLSVGGGHSIASLTVLAPLVAANVVGPWETALYGAAAVVAWGVLGIFDSQFATSSATSAARVRVAGIVLGSVIAVVAAVIRRQRDDKLERIERVAEVVQRAILAPLPNRIGPVTLAARYESSTQDAEVGGDFYAAAAIECGAVVLIGDVRGKGLDAVRLGAEVLGAFRERVEDGVGLDELMHRLHRAVLRRANPGDFVTAALLSVNDVGAALLLSAGHPPPILLRGDQTTFLAPSVVRPPLGVDGVGESLSFQLRRNDGILLYTDGATEARRPGDRAMRPESELARDAAAGSSATDTVQRALDGVLGWTGGHLGDDIALLSLRYQPQRAGLPLTRRFVAVRRAGIRPPVREG